MINETIIRRVSIVIFGSFLAFFHGFFNCIFVKHYLSTNVFKFRACFQLNGRISHW